jgi:hypothetical protein
MHALVATVWIAAACEGRGTEGDYYTEEGECTAPEDATDLGASPATLWDACLVETHAELQVIESEAAWQALFDCATPIPNGIDLSRQHAAVVHIRCSPTTFRFAAEADGELLVGIKTGISGACIGNPFVVPLPDTSKPVRLARCWDQCHGECPPVP